MIHSFIHSFISHEIDDRSTVSAAVGNKVDKSDVGKPRARASCNDP